MTKIIIFLLFMSCASDQKQFTMVDQLRRDFWSMQENVLQIVRESSNRQPAQTIFDEVLKIFINFEGKLTKVVQNGDEHREIRRIGNIYGIFQKIYKNGRQNPSTISFSQAMLNYSIIDMPKLLDKTNKLIYKWKETSAKDICSERQSKRQLVYNLYDTVAIAQTQGYFLLLVSQIFLLLNKKGNYTSLIELQKKFKQQTLSNIEPVKQALKYASGNLWKCEPEVHTQNITYIEMTNFLQGIIINEVNISPHESCINTCNQYKDTRIHSYIADNVCAKQRRCDGRIRQCWTAESNLSICPSTLRHRRYERVEFDNGRTYGRKGICHQSTLRAEDWLRWFVRCSYCVCLCDQEILSDRYISMRAVKSDIARNRVVTGLRFVKRSRVIHLQVQEAELLPRGLINNKTLRWVPINEFGIYDKEIYLNQDYFKVTWDNRAIDLDDLVANTDSVLTGVRFKKLGTHLNFEILTTRFNFETGILKPPISRWIDNTNTEYTANKRKKLLLKRPDVPLKGHGETSINSVSNQFVEITHTDFEWDAAQTTIPFFDAQPVESKFPVPLSGAGIYHKGKKNSGGFIAPKIITFDYSHHLIDKEDVPTV